MKYFAWFAGVVAVALTLLYAVLFTPFGNSMLQPIIESKIQEQTKLESSLSVFSLNLSEFEIFLQLNAKNSIHVKGNYSLFSQTFDIAYRVKFDELQNLKELTQAPLQGSFHTDGTLKGDLSFMQVNGKSNVANSDTTYHIELTDLNPTSIIAKVKDANLALLLNLAGQSAYANAEINLDIQFKNITPHALDGNILLETKKGKMDVDLMRKDFGVNLPDTAFAMNLDAKLHGDDIDYNYILSSNLAEITSSGKVVPQPFQADIAYALNIKELAMFKPLTGADVRGALRLKGKVIGNKTKLIVDGKSDFASSDTSFEAILKEFALASIRANMNNLELAKVFYMLNQPHYADGIFTLNVDISDARGGNLKGNVVSSIKNGLLDSGYLSKTYAFKTSMPKTEFKLNSNTALNGNLLDTQVNFASTLANFDIKRARFDIKEGALLSDYRVHIPDLDKLYFASQRHLKGGLSANGELKKGKDLDLTIHSKVAGGVVDAKLHNDDFTAELQSLQTLDILHILIYPEMFKSTLVGALNYNLAESKGEFRGNLLEGTFTKNQMLDLVKQYAKVNLYIEKFTGEVRANINKENIVASMDLKSNTSSIKTQNTKLNSKTKTIDSTVTVVANKYPLTLTLKGDAASPKIGVDVKELMESKTGEVIKKEATKLFKSLF
ncbi:hypothetical protein KKG72_02680 [bacterium]|nr:hypothetical protein [bacterium]MBU1994262.1 hypothetical protein [bacterium]